MSFPSTQKPSLAVDLIAGFASGVTSKLVEHPFDTVKVLMQVNGNGVYKSSFDCFKKTMTLYGIKGLYRGIQFPLLGSIVENGLTFVSYGYFKKLLGVTDPNHMSFTQITLSSMGSGAVIALEMSPVELLKCRLQIEQSYTPQNSVLYKRKSTSFGVIGHVLKEEGIFGLFRGLQLTLLREIPGTALWFISYEMSLKVLLRMGYTRENIPLAGIIGAGSISGAVYWSTIYPIDTIKSIMQTDTTYLNQIKGNGISKVKSIVTYLVHLSRTLRLKGLYCGLGFTLIRAIPTNAVLFLSYEYVTRLLYQYAK